MSIKGHLRNTFFVFRSRLFEACTVSDNSLWNLAFRKCVDWCPCYLTPDTRTLCLGKEHAHSVLEGAICVHYERFPMKKLRSRLSPLLEGTGTNTCTPRLRSCCHWGKEDCGDLRWSLLRCLRGGWPFCAPLWMPAVTCWRRMCYLLYHSFEFSGPLNRPLHDWQVDGGNGGHGETFVGKHG